jgi:hypothetical protein
MLSNYGRRNIYFLIRVVGLIVDSRTKNITIDNVTHLALTFIAWRHYHSEGCGGGGGRKCQRVCPKEPHDASCAKHFCTNFRDWQNISYRVTKNKWVFEAYFDEILSEYCFTYIMFDVEMGDK